MKLVVPDVLLKDNRITRYAYLVATFTALLLMRRAKDSTIPREVSFACLFVCLFSYVRTRYG